MPKIDYPPSIVEKENIVKTGVSELETMLRNHAEYGVPVKEDLQNTFASWLELCARLHYDMIEFRDHPERFEEE